jgi:2-polyprenyl-6-methoxyphenol hydroxylase-like FAD-dependent oxidoreductase
MTTSAPNPPASPRPATCCVVGAGPAGMMLSLILARRGVPVTLVEAHHDFDRDFRGDTIHPSTLEILDQLGLADRLHEIPHGKMHALTLFTSEGPRTMASMRGLRTKFPYVMLLAQARFLEFLAEEARRFPTFHLELSARVESLIEEGGAVKGVRFRRGEAADQELRAGVVVGCDGRFSKLRSLAGLEPIRSAPPMDVVWFRLPRHDGDQGIEGGLYVGGGRFAVVFDRGPEWQVGFVILKGNFAQVKQGGIEAIQQGVAQLVPWLAGRVSHLSDWRQTTLLSVESNRLPVWYKSGLLLIGDAAHVMSPVGGVGINFAIQDAVEAANVLAPRLLAGRVDTADLAEVQRRRERPTRIIQAFQAFLQRRIAAPALGEGFRLPWIARVVTGIPILNRLPGRMIGFGPRRVRVEGV